jgi:hypothetical protein
MNTVWSFGDSMTAEVNGLPEEPSPYRQWLGRDAKDTATFVAEEFGFESKNLAVGGSSNTAIFHQFISQLKNIQSGDILIFGWTVIARYRIGVILNPETPNPAWKTIWSQGLSNIPEYGCVDDSYITKEVAEQIILNRSELGDLYGSEVNEWIEFINDWAKLKGVMAIHWSWCNAGMGGKQNLNLSFDVVRYTDMFRETKSVVRDGHYGEVGYKQLADDVIKYIKNNYE